MIHNKQFIQTLPTAKTMPKRKRSDKSPAAVKSTDPSENLRFEVELEFVQCLSNVEYIHHLANIGTLEDLKFIKYLEYMHETWTQPEYARFLTFPHCLAYLALLQEPTFRQEMKSPQFFASAKNQQELHFFHARTAKVIDPHNP